MDVLSHEFYVAIVNRYKQNKLINLLRKISGQIGIPACPSYPIENAISIYVLHAYMAIAISF